MKAIVIILATVICVEAKSQSTASMRIDTSRESVLYWSKWTEDLYDMGVGMRNDSFVVREEVVRLLKDETYRNTIYPATYDWKNAIKLMQQMDLKQAFWHLINLYQSDTAHRHLVLGTIVLYDSLIDMDKIMLSSFYTYAFADPRVCRIINGKPDIYRPDLLEKGLRATREITNNIWAYRKKKTNSK